MIKDKIYQAQCFGNIEPIEYMVPYPNLHSLAVGQCIKFSDNLLFMEDNLSNAAFLKLINQYSNWLETKDIKKGDNVYIDNIPSPYFDIMCYAVWGIGATLVISDDKNASIEARLTINDPSIIEKINDSNISKDYTTKVNVLLNDIAVQYYHKGKAIILSHYNLLINAYGIFKELNLLYNKSIKVDIPISNTAFIVLNTILPLYAGTSITTNDPDIVFGSGKDSDYQILFDWNDLANTNPQSLYVLPEATAILAIGSKPNHLTSIKVEEDSYKINGHSVMMGYLKNDQNTQAFKNGSLVISK